MAILNNIANSLKSSASSSGGGSSSSSGSFASSLNIGDIKITPSPTTPTITPEPSNPFGPFAPSEPKIVGPSNPTIPGFEPSPNNPFGPFAPNEPKIVGPSNPTIPGFEPSPNNPFGPFAPNEPKIVGPSNPTPGIDSPLWPNSSNTLTGNGIDSATKNVQTSGIKSSVSELINKNTSGNAIANAAEKAEAEQIKKTATEFLKNNGNGSGSEKLKNLDLDTLEHKIDMYEKKPSGDIIDKITDAELKEQINNFKNEGLTEDQIKSKLMENEKFDKITDADLKEKMIDQYVNQYNKTSVNGLINSSSASFITGGAVGLVSGGDRMNITISEIPFIVSKLRSCESRVREIWSDLLNTYINQIENSWAGADAQAYIEKVRSYNTKIENSAQALSLLADTYEKVISTSQDTYHKVITDVNNL